MERRLRRGEAQFWLGQAVFVVGFTAVLIGAFGWSAPAAISAALLFGLGGAALRYAAIKAISTQEGADHSSQREQDESSQQTQG